MLSVTNLLRTTALLSLMTTVQSVTSWDTTPKSDNSSTLIKRLTSWDTTRKSNNSSTLINRLTSWDTTPKSNNSSTLIKRLTVWDTTPKSDNSSTSINRHLKGVVGEKNIYLLRRNFKRNIKPPTNFEDDKITQTILANNDKHYNDYFNPTFHPQNVFKCPPCICKNFSSNSVSVICEDTSLSSIPQSWPVEIDEIIIRYRERLRVLDLRLLLMYTSLTRVEIRAELRKVFSSCCLIVSSTLIDLYLKSNSISEIEENCFLNFPNLQKLSLSYNSLENLTKEMFTGLRSLLYLSVARNRIKCIANNTFDDMSNLVTLDISRNQIIYTGVDLLPVGIFIHLRNLEQLYIERICEFETYQCGSYPNKALQVLTNLKHLAIDGADSRGLGPEIKSLAHLTNLIITYSFVDNVSDESYFDNVPFITTLKFCNMKPHITPKAFEKLTHLVNLTYSLEGNKDLCKYFTDIKYFLNSSLKYLTLSNVNRPKSRCIELNEQHAVYLKSLRLIELDLSDNYLVKISQGFILMLPETLQKIDLSGNSLNDVFFYSLKYFPKELLEINLSNQEDQYHARQTIEDNDKRFIAKDKVQSKKTLNVPAYSLKNHNAETVEKTTCYILPPKLQILRADNFKKFGDHMVLTVDTRKCSLKRLSLSGGEVRDWSHWLYFGTIEMADFSKNYAKNCYALPYYTKTSMRYLSMSNNLFGKDFESYPEGAYFENMKHLIALDISENSIKLIANVYLKNLLKLQILDISDNKLQTINISFSHMTKLRFLNFSTNSITSISKLSRESLDLIAADHRLYLDLTSNPLPCTCDGLELMKWMAFTNVYLLNQDFLVCRNEFNEVLEIGNIVHRMKN